jgi:hypothetical protein
MAWYLLFGVVGFLTFSLLSKLAIESRIAETRDLTSRQEEESRLRDALAEANRGLTEARARTAVADDLKRRQLAKVRAVATRVAEIIEQGGSIQYKFEHAKRTDEKKFFAEFERVHAGAIETWRGDTAKALDQELPGLGLGATFSAIDGQRGVSGDVFQFFRLRRCIEWLQALQERLPTYVEQIVE